jgi:lipid-binding SYLF domain-containing protein
MRKIVRIIQGILLLALAFLPMHSALAASASEIDRNATAALQTLYKTTPGAKELASNAKGILIFPNIVKAGFIIGGQYGEVSYEKRAGRWGTIGQSRLHTGYRQVCSPLAMYCFSWTMHLCNT